MLTLQIRIEIYLVPEANHLDPTPDQSPRDKLLEHSPEVINSNCVEKVTQLKE